MHILQREKKQEQDWQWDAKQTFSLASSKTLIKASHWKQTENLSTCVMINNWVFLEILIKF